MLRTDNRLPTDLRTTRITANYLLHAEGSVLIEVGRTKVICTASIEDRVPPFLRGQGKGWVTAEYGMLPRATNERTRREASSGKQSGRTLEIQRLIGRSLRAVVDLPALGERQIIVDCDVVQADGGTRTAAITGGWIALRDCIEWMASRDMVSRTVLRDHVAAVSAGIFRGTPVLDLDYIEDSEAETDAISWLHAREGTASVVVAVFMAAVLLFLPRGLTGGREFAIPRARRPGGKSEAPPASTAPRPQP